MKKEKDIKLITYKAFMRVMKENGLCQTVSDSFKHIRVHKSAPTLLNYVTDLTVNDGPSHGMIPQAPPKYQKIIETINLILYNVLEKHGVNQHLIAKCGQEIFEIVCYTLYGNDYSEEKKKMEKEFPHHEVNIDLSNYSEEQKNEILEYIMRMRNAARH